MEPKWAFAQNFDDHFHRSAAEVASRINILKYTPPTSSDTIDLLAVDIQRLAKGLSEATGSLPSYGQRRCEIQLKSLEKAVEDLRDTSSRESKFSFRRRIQKEKAVGESMPTSKDELLVMNIGFELRSLSHRYLTVSDMGEENLSREVTLSSLTACLVNLLPIRSSKTSISAMYVKDIMDCVLLLPHISGSILLSDSSRCVVVVGCQQFRMHNSNNIDIYFRGASNPVIENCSAIRFAEYPHILAQSSDEDLSLITSCGQDDRPVVQDFTHIRSTPSPNWCVLPEGEREQNWPLSPLEGQTLFNELTRILPGTGETPSTLSE